jgi:protein PhnA
MRAPAPATPSWHRRIRLTGKPDEIECNTKKVKGLVLRTTFLKKA